MGIPSEFQEREYESLFIQEFAKLGSFTWSPGQTDENLLGFDGALWVTPWRLIRMGFPTHVSPSRLRRMLWPFWPPDFWDGERLHPGMIDAWAKFADEAFPKKAVNFFVQHKRPFQTTEQGDCGDHWGQAYFEYKIDKKQQCRLEKLEQKLAHSAVVTYCCAAFLKKRELWEHEESNTIVSHSNFVSAKKLSGHKRYTFIKAGHSGFANAEPTAIEDEPIQERLALAYQSSDLSLTSQIKAAGKVVHEIMSDEDDAASSELYHLLLGRMLERIDEFGEGLLPSILRVLAFNSVNSTSWSIITAPSMKTER